MTLSDSTVLISMLLSLKMHPMKNLSLLARFDLQACLLHAPHPPTAAHEEIAQLCDENQEPSSEQEETRNTADTATIDWTLTAYL